MNQYLIDEIGDQDGLSFNECEYDTDMWKASSILSNSLRKLGYIFLADFALRNAFNEGLMAEVSKLTSVNLATQGDVKCYQN